MGRNSSTNLRMMPLFPSLQWNGRKKTNVVVFNFTLFFLRAGVSSRHFMELLSSKWQPQLYQTVASHWWQEFCRGLVTHSVIVLWEICTCLGSVLWRISSSECERVSISRLRLRSHWFSMAYLLLCWSNLSSRIWHHLTINTVLALADNRLWSSWGLPKEELRLWTGLLN